MQKLIDEIKKTSGDLARRGWAESNGGNISLRLNPENYAYFNGLQPKSDGVKLPITMPEIAGERFMVTGTGRFLRNIEVFPEKNIGVIEIDQKGEAWQLLWGYEPAGAPTSELPSHLLSHCRIKEKSDNQSFAFIHTHPNSVIALTRVFLELGERYGSFYTLLLQAGGDAL